jgi:drug/metabolite transporter (DMT)-like permease
MLVKGSEAMQTRHLGALLLLGAIWGLSFLFIKIGVSELLPEVLVAMRLVIAALILLGVLYARGLRMPTSLRTWGDLLFVGIVGTILPYLLIAWGEVYIASGMASILNATTPFSSVLLAYVWTHEERLNGLKLIGVAVGFVGVLVAIGLKDLSLTSAGTLGQLAVLGAALCYAITAIYGRRAFRGMPPLVPATGQMLTGALVMTPLVLALHGVPRLPSPLALGAVLALSVFGTAFAYILYYWLLEQTGATRTSMVTYLTPPFALVYGALFLREPITLGALLGLGLVIVGILLSNSVIQRSTFSRRPVQVRDDREPGTGGIETPL